MSGGAAGPLRPHPSGVLLLVHAQPGARRDEVAGLHGERLRVRIAAPATEGRANERLVEVLARALGVRRSAVTIASGHSSREKAVMLEGLRADEVARRLGLAGPAQQS